MAFEITNVKKEFVKELESTDSLQKLRDLEIYYFGKKGIFSELFQKLKEVTDEKEKKGLGLMINSLKEEISNELKNKKIYLEKIERDNELLKEKIDVTLPGVILPSGRKHILSRVEEEIENIFMSMGFDIKEGPEIETDYFNFEALNIPKNHPARDMQDTFYIDEEYLLRTHTSPIQIRTMKESQPPVKIIATGRCFRRDPFDASHSPIFHQVEGLVIDKNITFSDLKGVLSEFVKGMFGSNIKVKLLPSYFPFVEPGAETAISCVVCGGKGCPTCKYSGWIEMGGSGMVHKNVLKGVGYDPNIYQGFAFGWGIERIAMVKYGIKDIRLFYENNIEFLSSI